LVDSELNSYASALAAEALRLNICAML